MSTKFRLAACVLLPTEAWREEILAISRPKDPTMWGMPGGKQDPGESNLNTAKREVREEVGIDISGMLLVPIYSGPCFGKDGVDYWVTTYLPDQTFSTAEIKPEEGLIVQRMSIVDLCRTTNSPFADYNRSVMMAWRRYIG